MFTDLLSPYSVRGCTSAPPSHDDTSFAQMYWGQRRRSGGESMNDPTHPMRACECVDSYSVRGCTSAYPILSHETSFAQMCSGGRD